MFRIISASVIAALTALPAPSILAADTYPQKPIRIVIPFPPGGGTDITARGVQPQFETALGGGIVIDNRGGAGGTLGCTIASRATPDGYTLLFTSASFTFAPSLYKNLGYDAVKDFRPITNFAQAALVLLVHPSMPVKSVKELLALAKARPGEIFYASAGIGSNIFMTTELFKHKAGIDLKQVPFRGGGPALIGIMSGEAQVLMTSVMSSAAHVKSGRLRALAVTTKERSPVMPDLPTIDESGVPGYDKGVWFGLFAPSGVPEPIIKHVYQAAAKVLKDPATAKRLANEGAVPVGNPPDEFGAFVRSEIEEWGKLIRTMGIKPQ